MMIRLNNKYKSLIKDNSRFYVISGGRGSGKSYSVATYLLMLTFEKNRTILFVRYTMTSTRISIYPEFLNKIELLGLEKLFDITQSEIINKETGSKIIFKGMKTGSSVQTANLKSIANVDTLVVDEAEEIPSEEVFDRMELSIRSNEHHNRIIILFNPTSKASWIYERFYEKKGVEPGLCLLKDDTTYIHTTYKDIEDKLPASYVERFKLMERENKKKYDHIVMGAFLDKAEGVIFTNWSIGEFPDIDYGFGQDFGFSSDETTLVKVGIDNKNMIIYLDEIIYESGLTTTDIYNRSVDIVGNNLIVADNAEPRLIEELKRKGLNIKPCVKGAGSIEAGILLMMDYKIVVSESSINIIKELNNYVWSDKKGNKPIDMYNHSLDAIRYYVSHMLKKPKIKKYNIY